MRRREKMVPKMSLASSSSLRARLAEMGRGVSGVVVVVVLLRRALLVELREAGGGVAQRLV
jgi:hypothetical protein